LFTHKENTIPTHHSKIMITTVKQEDFETVNRNIKELIAATNSSDEMELVSLMKNMVSEFKSNYSKFETLDQKQISIN
ncbi:MAG: polysaccharide biosynthesis protein, partial [Bacteroidetes bacterium]|nr:polysaccharide biosynthesis protein [Bacteroidota bacterium]